MNAENRARWDSYVHDLKGMDVLARYEWAILAADDELCALRKVAEAARDYYLRDSAHNSFRLWNALDAAGFGATEAREGDGGN